MSYYREVRVRPVVRYIVTLFERIEEVDDKGLGVGHQTSSPLGEFDDVHSANNVASALWRDYMRESETDPSRVTVFEPARKLRIDWIRGPGEPQEAIRWELSEVEPIEMCSICKLRSGQKGRQYIPTINICLPCYKKALDGSGEPDCSGALREAIASDIDPIRG